MGINPSQPFYVEQNDYTDSSKDNASISLDDQPDSEYISLINTTTDNEDTGQNEYVKNDKNEENETINWKKEKLDFLKYIHDQMKTSYPEVEMTDASLQFINDFLNSVLDRLQNGAEKIKTIAKRKVLTDADIRLATYFIVPGKMGECADIAGMEACTYYRNSYLSSGKSRINKY